MREEPGKVSHLRYSMDQNWCFWIVVLEKTIESPLDSKEIKPVNPKGNQPKCSLEGLMLKARSSNMLATWCKEPTHWERPWCWERLKAKGEAATEVVRWHHWLNGQGSEQTPDDGEGQGSQACCSPQGCRVRHDWATEQKRTRTPTRNSVQGHHIPWPPSTSSPTPPRLGWLGATQDWKDQVHTLLEPRSLAPLRHPSASSGVVATVGHSFLCQNISGPPRSPAECRGQSPWPWCSQ